MSFATTTNGPRTAVQLIGVPLDLGASRRGVDMGPSAMRLSSLVQQLSMLGITVQDMANVTVPERATLPPTPDAALEAITRVCAETALWTAAALRDGATPLVLGGDHSIAAGSVSGSVAACAEQDQPVGLLWLDAHADINTPETSLSGNVHGMPVAHLLGLGHPPLTQLSGQVPAIRPEHVAYVGLRDLDEAERRAIRALGIRAFTMRDLDERGLRSVMEEALEITTRGTAGVHVSFDLDWVDPSVAPGVGTPVQGGATRREAHLAMEIIHDRGAMLALDLVEVNPILDHRNATAELAADLVASAFGRRIL